MHPYKSTDNVAAQTSLYSYINTLKITQNGNVFVVNH
jgi:hypothetical protein